jgi:hypothetical protein
MPKPSALQKNRCCLNKEMLHQNGRNCTSPLRPATETLPTNAANGGFSAFRSLMFYAAYGRLEPLVQDAERGTNVCFHRGELNTFDNRFGFERDYGSVKHCRSKPFQNEGFARRLAEQLRNPGAMQLGR